MSYRLGDARLPDRFWSKVEVDQESGCWLWAGSQNKFGYGDLMTGSRSDGSRRVAKAHRYAYESLVESISEGLTIDHLCQRPSCVNPAHLEPVTQQINSLRSLSNPAAANRQKVTCSRGHPLFGDNLVIDSGGRRCKTCRKNHNDARRADPEKRVRDNQLSRERRPRKGRAKGERHGRSRLTEAGVREIWRRIARGDKTSAIAADLNVAPATIHSVISGQTWRHIRQGMEEVTL